MRLLFIIIIIIATAIPVLSQPLKNDCFVNNNPTTKITLKSYPFNKASRILLVKYKALAIQGKPNYFSWDSVQSIPKRDNKIDSSKFLQTKQLSTKGVDSLIFIINLRNSNNYANESNLIEPSNAIIFVDKKGEIFDYIVICFTQYDNSFDYSEMSSHNKLTLGWWCSIKAKLLANFFVTEGIDIVVSKWY